MRQALGPTGATAPDAPDAAAPAAATAAKRPPPPRPSLPAAAPSPCPPAAAAAPPATPQPEPPDGERSPEAEIAPGRVPERAASGRSTRRDEPPHRPPAAGARGPRRLPLPRAGPDGPPRPLEKHRRDAPDAAAASSSSSRGRRPEGQKQQGRHRRHPGGGRPGIGPHRPHVLPDAARRGTRRGKPPDRPGASSSTRAATGSCSRTSRTAGWRSISASNSTATRRQHGHTVEFYHQYFRTDRREPRHGSGGAPPETHPHRLPGGTRRTVPEAVLLAGRHLRPARPAQSASSASWKPTAAATPGG